MNLDVRKANYTDPTDAQAVVALLSEYATSPMGGGVPLTEYAQKNLVTQLATIPHAFSVLCYTDAKPAGLANCFFAFSTFKCAPLVNIHDLVVTESLHGCGIGQQLLRTVEQIAHAHDCASITLEVLSGNKQAQGAYRKYGFVPYQLDPKSGYAHFWHKLL